MPFDGRLAHLEEQVEPCRLLWRESPASFAGRHIRFDEVYCRPFPVQRPGIPIWLGIAPSERSAPRIARLADGWVPAYPTPEGVAAGMCVIRPQLAARGRDPDLIEVRAGLMPVNRNDDSVDLDATFAQVPAYIAAGATMIDATTALVSRRDDLTRSSSAWWTSNGGSALNPARCHASRDRYRPVLHRQVPGRYATASAA